MNADRRWPYNGIEYIPTSISEDLTNTGNGTAVSTVVIGGEAAIQVDPPLAIDGVAADPTDAENGDTARDAELRPAQPPVPYNWVNVSYWGVNLASVTEYGDNGGAPGNTYYFAPANPLQLGSQLSLVNADGTGTRNLRMLLANGQTSGTLVIIAYGAGDSDCECISVGAVAP